MHMNKGRLEAFSDGIFAIAMTLLVFNMHVPTLYAGASNAMLWQQLYALVPSIVVYFISFAVLSVFWINHHFLFHTFAKAVDRRLNLLNLAYLMFIAFVPFSASLIGQYHTYQAAAVVYGLNIFCVVFLSAAMMRYMKSHKTQLLSDTLSQRLINQARFRSRLSLSSYVIGVLASFVSVHLSLFFFAFPIIFNIIPGTLDAAERVFKFDLGSS